MIFEIIRNCRTIENYSGMLYFLSGPFSSGCFHYKHIFRIRNVLDAVIVVVGFATVLAVVLVFVLSLRLRQREIQTIFRLGCRKMTIARLLGAEILIIVAMSAVICTGILLVLDHYASDLVRMLFIR